MYVAMAKMTINASSRSQEPARNGTRSQRHRMFAAIEQQCAAVRKSIISPGKSAFSGRTFSRSETSPYARFLLLDESQSFQVAEPAIAALRSRTMPYMSETRL